MEHRRKEKRQQPGCKRRTWSNFQGERLDPESQTNHLF
jgi:hypothetical protein